MTERQGRAGQIAAIAVLVLVAAGAVYWLLRPDQQDPVGQQAPPHRSAAPQNVAPQNEAVVAPARTTQAGKQVSDTVARAYSFDTEHLRKHATALGQAITGPARAKLDAMLQQTRARSRGQKVTLTTKVTAHAVTQLRGETARVLLVLSEDLRGAGNAKRHADARMLATAQQRGLRWQVIDTDTTFATPQRPPATRARTVAPRGGLPPAQLAAQRDLLVATAMRDADVVSSADYRAPARSIDATAAVTTGALHDRIVSGRAAAQRRIAAGKRTAVARSVAAGVSSLDLDAGRARVLVTSNVTVTRAGGKPKQQPSTVGLSMQRVGGAWQVAGVRQF